MKEGGPEIIYVVKKTGNLKMTNTIKQMPFPPSLITCYLTGASLYNTRN